MRRSLLKSASLISSGTFLSRILGFARDVLIARIFGTGWIIQAFFVAFKIPNMFRELAAEGASNAAFVPVFSEYLATKPKKEFWSFVNTLFLAFILVVSLITFLGIVFSPVLVRLIAPGFIQMPEKLNLTVMINRYVFVYLVFICVATFMIGLLHTFKRFFAPSFSPCFFNIALIAAIAFSDNSLSGINKLILAVLAAGIIQILIQLPELLRVGFKFYPFEFQKKLFAHPGVRKVGRLLLPRIIGSAVYQLNILVDTIFASLTFLVGSGAVAAIYYAARLIQFPLGIFGSSISNATLPTLSELSAQKNIKRFAETVEFSLTNILFVIIPSSIGLIVLSSPITRIIFQRGAFNQYSSLITSTALTFYAVGLAGYAANRFLAICFNALQDTVTPVKISGLALLLNIVFNVLFVVVLKTRIAGLALASSLSATISAVVLFNRLRLRIKYIDSGKILIQIMKMLASALVMIPVVLNVYKNTIHFLPSWAGLFLTIWIGMVVYLALGFCLGIYQCRKLFKWISGRK